MKHRAVCKRWCMVVVLASVAPIAGCGSASSGRYPDAGSGTGSEAPPDAGGGPPPDAAPPAARCDPSKPFGAPVPVANINSTVRDQGAILMDDLTLLFGSDRGGATDIYVAKRSSPAGPFGTPTVLPGVSTTTAAESAPSLTDDGLTLYYAVIPANQTVPKLYVTTRASRSADFPAGSPVAQINSSVDDVDPYITPDGAALYFDSARSGGLGLLDSWVAVRRGDGSFDAPQPLTNLNTSNSDGHPHLTHDGLTIYWSSNRTDGGAAGGNDIWMATRASTAGTFGTPTRVVELSSASDESLSWISADGCEVLLQSNRTGTLGSQDIFDAKRPL